MTVETKLEEQAALLHVRVSDKLTRADYETFVPEANRLIENRGKIRILFEMHDFHGWTAGALWSDLTFGIKHFRDVARLALVGERSWQKGIVLFCKPFIGARVRYFEQSEGSKAREWLLADLGRAEHEGSFDLASFPPDVAALLRQLGSPDGDGRQKARTALVKMGPAASAHLIKAATQGGPLLRLEATQALGAIADPKSATVLASQFEDTFEIGWAAADGLSKLGRPGGLAVLHELIQHPGLHGVRVSAHHALREMQDLEIRKLVAPVVTALADSAPAQQAPVAALAAMEQLGH